MNYYNEIKPYAVDWLWNLIDARLIPGQTVDRRSIVDVGAETLGHDRCHFFAGLGGWELALQMAGWPEDQAVWTGSCPCQPFSNAGKRKGKKDARHLWPAFLGLITKCRPPVVFGEQVASTLGRQWLSGVRSDLEGIGYRFGAADLPAACVSAPHGRQRLFWVADTNRNGRSRKSEQNSCEASWQQAKRRGDADGRSVSVGLGNAGGQGLQGMQQEVLPRSRGREEGGATPESSPSPWNAYGIIAGSDGKLRRVEPRTFPLAYGLPGKVGKLRAYGNAIVPQVAAKFVRAYMETFVS